MNDSTPPSEPRIVKGSCVCGAMRFEAELPSLWVAHCHCSQCRRAHGAGFVTWVGMEDRRVRIDDSGQTLRWYASSRGAQRGFCADCGSPLFFRSERWPGELHIARAHFADEVDRAPQAHVCWGSRVLWSDSDPADGLPRKE